MKTFLFILFSIITQNRVYNSNMMNETYMAIHLLNINYLECFSELIECKDKQLGFLWFSSRPQMKSRKLVITWLNLLSQVKSRTLATMWLEFLKHLDQRPLIDLYESKTQSLKQLLQKLY